MKILTDRKTLWYIIAGYVAAIYLTLGLIGRLSLWLRNNGWQTGITTAMLFVAFVVSLYVIVVILGRRSVMNIITLAAAGCVYTYIVFAFQSSPSNRIHIIEYSLLAALLYYAIKIDVNSRSAYVLAWIITVVIGFGDEMIQYYLPTRAYDLNDIMVNSIAAAVALLVISLVVESGE
ncbi:hypothetical protein MNBD_NITROSPINAE02-2015 [hydrothermal vent metagenome]|uniref:VanZ-like domain-containing protein n=1 Tax=hydrothermal vent metagenome TaxID=652676 RepID=A0A3B1CKX2_9ZZZZ